MVSPVRMSLKKFFPLFPFTLLLTGSNCGGTVSFLCFLKTRLALLNISQGNVEPQSVLAVRWHDLVGWQRAWELRGCEFYSPSSTPSRKPSGSVKNLSSHTYREDTDKGRRLRVGKCADPENSRLLLCWWVVIILTPQGKPMTLTGALPWVTGRDSCWDKIWWQGLGGRELMFIEFLTRDHNTSRCKEERPSELRTKSSLSTFSRYLKNPGKGFSYIFHRWETWDSRRRNAVPRDRELVKIGTWP